MMKLKDIAKVNFKYVAVRKMKCYHEEVKISHKALETIVEMSLDYSAILSKKLEGMEGYNRALYSYKVKEINKIAELIAGAIGYNKSCPVEGKKKNNTGIDTFELLNMTKEERVRL